MARAELVSRARALVGDQRSVLGLTGAPGAGKSTLARELAAALPGSVVVPMDGFHLPTARLAELGLVGERGTPRTFDAAGYVDLLRALRTAATVRAPAFDRMLEEPVAAAIDIPATARLVITEGNYLLLDDPPWSGVRDPLDEVWFVEVPEAVRIDRLIARHVEFGRPRAEARERATRGSDAANARLVAASRSRADLVVELAP
jgi:pantothenate kinase